jgi:glutaminyl-tRNA synthetase
MAERTDFIREIIDDDLRAGRHTRVATRFPPEPNGYLHIGHAKSICLNFGIARDYRGTCNLRYDDTNPTKEDVEYVDSIERDVRWLGFAPTGVLFSADYFPRMYELAERLVRDGLAYVCDLDDDAIRRYRGTLSEPGTPSPFRNRPIDENLDLLRRMKAGEFVDGARTLRAKIDMASANMKMRDPLLYRIRHAHHHRTGDAWCIYPMYDYAHPIEDAIEGITHSICTLEFENNRELYDWVLDHTGPWNPRPHQYEFARLALDYTVMSKRKLLQLVRDGLVSGWDDPRMPTLSGMRRRGFSAEAIRAFCDMIGVAKTNSMVDVGKLEYCVRDDLNHNAPRVLGVLHPVEVEVEGDIGARETSAPYFPADVGKPGARALAIGSRIFIDRDDWRDEPPADYKRLALGRTVRLRHGYCLRAEEVLGRNADGDVTKLRARVVAPEKGLSVIHWVDAATSVPCEVRLYDRLFKTAKPEEGGGDFVEQLAPDSLVVVHGARVEASLAAAEIGSRWQLERVAYFVIDPDSAPLGAPGAHRKLVLTRIITLREALPAQEEAAPAADRKDNAKAKTRPKSKSPAEYRAEARTRNPDLARVFELARAKGLSEEQADLLSGDAASATLFEATLARGAEPDVVAKWIINEVPSEHRHSLAADDLAALIASVKDQVVTHAAAKRALAEALSSGARASDIARRIAAAPTADPSTAIEATLAAHPDKVAEYRGGRTGLLGFFVGQVMKAMPNADATAVQRALRERLT